MATIKIKSLVPCDMQFGNYNTVSRSTYVTKGAYGFIALNSYESGFITYCNIYEWSSLLPGLTDVMLVFDSLIELVSSRISWFSAFYAGFGVTLRVRMTETSRLKIFMLISACSYRE